MQIQESFLEGLVQDVVAERIEIDYVDLRGPAFETWDRRALPRRKADLDAVVVVDDDIGRFS